MTVFGPEAGRCIDRAAAALSRRVAHLEWFPFIARCGLAVVGRLGEPGQDLTSEDVDEFGLAGTDLMKVDMIEAGIDVGLDMLDMAIKVWPADDLLGDHLLGHELGELLEMTRVGQLLPAFAGDGGRGPKLGRHPPGPPLVGVPTERQLPVTRASLAESPEPLHDLPIRSGRDETVADLSCQLSGSRP